MSGVLVDQHLKVVQAADWNIKPIPKDMYSMNCKLLYTNKQFDMIKKGKLDLKKWRIDGLYTMITLIFLYIGAGQVFAYLL